MNVFLWFCQLLSPILCIFLMSFKQKSISLILAMVFIHLSWQWGPAQPWGQEHEKESIRGRQEPWWLQGESWMSLHYQSWILNVITLSILDPECHYIINPGSWMSLHYQSWILNVTTLSILNPECHYIINPESWISSIVNPESWISSIVNPESWISSIVNPESWISSIVNQDNEGQGGDRTVSRQSGIDFCAKSGQCRSRAAFGLSRPTNLRHKWVHLWKELFTSVRHFVCPLTHFRTVKAIYQVITANFFSPCIQMSPLLLLWGKMWDLFNTRLDCEINQFRFLGEKAQSQLPGQTEA